MCTSAFFNADWLIFMERLPTLACRRHLKKKVTTNLWKYIQVRPLECVMWTAKMLNVSVISKEFHVVWAEIFELMSEIVPFLCENSLRMTRSKVNSFHMHVLHHVLCLLLTGNMPKQALASVWVTVLTLFPYWRFHTETLVLFRDLRKKEKINK